MKTIAIENNCGETVIHKWLHRFDIPIRSRSEAMKGIPKTEQHKKHLSETRKQLDIRPWNYKGGQTIKPCIDCGTKNKGATSIRCEKCRYEFMIGKNSCNWKGGISKPMLKLRSLGAKRRRKLVLARDNYECQECGVDMDLCIHHIKPVKSFPKLVNDINNCITLCVHCHRKFHFSKVNLANSVKPQPFNRIEGVGNAEPNSDLMVNGRFVSLSNLKILLTD